MHQILQQNLWQSLLQKKCHAHTNLATTEKRRPKQPTTKFSIQKKAEPTDSAFLLSLQQLLLQSTKPFLESIAKRNQLLFPLYCSNDTDEPEDHD